MLGEGEREGDVRGRGNEGKGKVTDVRRGREGRRHERKEE